MVDMEAFALADPSLRLIVEAYLKKGKPVVIDGKTLGRFPELYYHPREIYEYYATHAKNFVLKSVNQFELGALFSKLRYTRALTLIDIYVRLEDDRDWWRGIPEFLHTLRVIDCILPELDKGIKNMSSLRTLHLQNSDHQYFSKKLRHLRELTLIQQSVSLDCPNLRTLTIDRCWSGLDCKRLHKLRHLRVLESVGYKEKAEIDALCLDSGDYYCCDIPTEENLILRLNDDCLMHLMQFLDQDSIVNLHEAHPRFANLKIPYFKIDYGSLRVRPFAKNIEYYTRIGALTTCLEVYDDEVCPDLIALFTNAKEMSLEALENNTMFPSIPNGVRHLKFLRLHDCNCDMSELFRRINPTLTVLHVGSSGSPAIRGLSELHNIQKITLHHLEVTEEWIVFLEQNKAHLLRIELHIPHQKDTQELQHKLMLVICQMRHLRTLAINWDLEDLPSIPQGSLPMLERLEISHRVEKIPKAQESLSKLLLSLDGSRLRSLELRHNIVNFDHVILNKFAKIRTCWFAIECHDEKTLLNVISGLPELTELVTYKLTHMAKLEKVRRYLIDNNRNLTWNGMKMV